MNPNPVLLNGIESALSSKSSSDGQSLISDQSASFFDPIHNLRCFPFVQIKMRMGGRPQEGPSSSSSRVKNGKQRRL
jgi:hypothetical protein